MARENCFQSSGSTSPPVTAPSIINTPTIDQVEGNAPQRVFIPATTVTLGSTLQYLVLLTMSYGEFMELITISYEMARDNGFQSSGSTSPPVTAPSIINRPNPNPPTIDQVEGNAPPRVFIPATTVTLGSTLQYQALLTMSYGMFMALMTISYQRVNGIIFPETLFSSHPFLFQIFVILNCLSFSFAIIGLWLQQKYKKLNECLYLFAVSTFMISIFIYIGDLLPSHFLFIPITLFICIFLVLFHVWVTKHSEEVDTNGTGNPVNEV